MPSQNWRTVPIEEIQASENLSLAPEDYVGEHGTFSQWLWQVQHSYWHMTMMQLDTSHAHFHELFAEGVNPEELARRIAQEPEVWYDSDGNPVCDDLDADLDRALEPREDHHQRAAEVKGETEAELMADFTGEDLYAPPGYPAELPDEPPDDYPEDVDWGDGSLSPEAEERRAALDHRGRP